MIERVQPKPAAFPHLLVIEDEESTQEVLRDVLSPSYTVSIAGSGTQALRYFTQRTVDLVVLDPGLPDMDGYEVCRRMRDVGPQALPILVLTANRDERGPAYGFQLGADDYLVKPFVPDELLARINRLLHRQRLLMAALDESSARTAMLSLAEAELQQQRATVESNGLVLGEFLHNVVNHTQALATVVENELRRVPSGLAREAVQRILGRIQGTAVVYAVSETLQSEPVRIDRVVEQIAQALKNVYSPRKRLPLTIEHSPLELPRRYAAPITLIVNELVTNCFRHAFPNQRFGKIVIRYGLRDARFWLEVADDGVGIAETAAVPSTRGRLMIEELVKTLGGTALWQPAPAPESGTLARIDFPIPQAAS